MGRIYSVKYVVLAGIIGLVVGIAVSPWPAATNAEKIEDKDSKITAETHTAQGETSLAQIKEAPDGEHGGSLMFSTRGNDGVLTEKMRLTKDGSLAVGTRVPLGYPRGGTPGNMNVVIDNPSCPGTIIMFNEHEAAPGVGNTLCWYASGEAQVFLISSWLGNFRRVKQEYNRPLPWQIPSPDYPGPASAARFDIGLKVHDWVSLAATFEPIADDGHAFVTIDREHPYRGMVQYLEPGGEWIYNRRIGRHALLVGTTHTTGATAGGVVLAGDSYHEYKGKGPVIKSPNGTAYRIVVDDNGKLSTEKF